MERNQTNDRKSNAVVASPVDGGERDSHIKNALPGRYGIPKVSFSAGLGDCVLIKINESKTLSAPHRAVSVAPVSQF